ncbi:MAG: response regulator [Verrucomicrobiota bacterium JB022]|nr:response regulator [Verrucomicrobiota bacterium JB022]
MPPTTKVFILDDDPAVTGLLKAKLGKVDGFEVRATNLPRQAASLIAQFQPHIVICDIDMGDFDGGMVARQLKDQPETANIPVLFLTSLVSANQVRQSEGVIGGRQMISKDATVPDLLQRIRTMLG